MLEFWFGLMFVRVVRLVIVLLVVWGGNCLLIVLFNCYCWFFWFSVGCIVCFDLAVVFICL